MREAGIFDDKKREPFTIHLVPFTIHSKKSSNEKLNLKYGLKRN